MLVGAAMPKSKYQRVSPENEQTLRKIKREKHLRSFDDVISLLLQERDPKYIEKLRGEKHDAKIANKTLRGKLREQEERIEVLVRENRDLTHMLEETRADQLKALEHGKKYFNENAYLRHRLNMKPLGTDFMDAMANHQQQETEAFPGMTDLIAEVDETIKIVNDCRTALEADYSRLAQSTTIEREV
jgi:hypothetical protein